MDKIQPHLNYENLIMGDVEVESDNTGKSPKIELSTTEINNQLTHDSNNSVDAHLFDIDSFNYDDDYITQLIHDRNLDNNIPPTHQKPFTDNQNKVQSQHNMPDFVTIDYEGYKDWSHEHLKKVFKHLLEERNDVLFTNNRLTHENNTLREENSRLSSENIQLRESNQHLKKQNELLEQKLEQIEQTNQLLFKLLPPDVQQKIPPTLDKQKNKDATPLGREITKESIINEQMTNDEADTIPSPQQPDAESRLNNTSTQNVDNNENNDVPRTFIHQHGRQFNLTDRFKNFKDTISAVKPGLFTSDGLSALAHQTAGATAMMWSKACNLCKWVINKIKSFTSTESSINQIQENTIEETNSTYQQQHQLTEQQQVTAEKPGLWGKIKEKALLSGAKFVCSRMACAGPTPVGAIGATGLVAIKAYELYQTADFAHAAIQKSQELFPNNEKNTHLVQDNDQNSLLSRIFNSVKAGAQDSLEQVLQTNPLLKGPISQVQEQFKSDISIEQTTVTTPHNAQFQSFPLNYTLAAHDALANNKSCAEPLSEKDPKSAFTIMQITTPKTNIEMKYTTPEQQPNSHKTSQDTLEYASPES